ncbi:SDR family oxidoreductase [Sporichthya brevicatena]|uniref:SDR family oxidoreductase n=1 Tax=Sporichthya brevicatena TaxID=171442 RepID=A0ABP3RB01_9ACTN
MPYESLRNKVAVVTGAAGGIGRETAHRLAADGAKVFCVDIDDKGALATVDEITAAGGTADAQGADVSSADDVEQAVTAAVTRFGKLDVMVNIAGVEHFAAVTEMLEADFERVLRINLLGTWLGTKYAAAAMTGGGSIINMSSLAGVVGFPGLTAYCASKAGVIMVTKTASIELRAASIRVNVVCPAFIDTPMQRRAMSVFDQMLGADGASIPMIERMQGRMGQPSDVTGTIAFLASDDASLTTGTTFVIDGGTSACLS